MASDGKGRLDLKNCGYGGNVSVYLDGSLKGSIYPGQSKVMEFNYTQNQELEIRQSNGAIIQINTFLASDKTVEKFLKELDAVPENRRAIFLKNKGLEVINKIIDDRIKTSLREVDVLLKQSDTLM